MCTIDPSPQKVSKYSDVRPLDSNEGVYVNASFSSAMSLEMTVIPIIREGHSLYRDHASCKPPVHTQPSLFPSIHEVSTDHYSKPST